MRLVDNQPHGRLVMADEGPLPGLCCICGNPIPVDTRTCSSCAVAAIDAILKVRAQK